MDHSSTSSGQHGAEAVGSGEAVASDGVGEDQPVSIRLAIKLAPKKQRVVEARAMGCDVAEAARRAGVDRTTASRWLHHDPKVIAAFNALVLENIKNNHMDMASMVPLANAAVRKELEKGNGWLGLQYMREAKSLGVLDVGPTSPKAVKEEMKLAKEIHEAELVKKQVQMREQQQEVEKLKEKIAQVDAKKVIESAEERDYWYAWMAFYSDWERHRNNPDQSRMSYLAFGALGGCSAEQFRRISDDAERRQQLDEEKRQRGEHAKSPQQQANEMRDQGERLHQQRQKEWDAAERKSNEQKAGNQPGVAAQQSTNDKEPSPDSQPPRKLSMVDESLADLKAAQAEFGAAIRAELGEGIDDNDDDDDQDDEAWEAPASKDAEQRVADESGKTNPDIGAADPAKESVAGAQPKPDCTAQPNNSELIDTDELDE